MKVLIFEGIATSGKSTIIKELKASFNDLHLNIAREAETHIPIMKETGDSHIDFFTALVKERLASNADLVIFDRLYLTQAFRAKLDIDSYREVEELLLPHTPLTIFLKVKDEAIAERIDTASKHREADWEQYIKTKGQSIKQIAEYYSTQQSNQLKLLKTSAIPYKIFDTTGHNYKEIASQLEVIITQPN